MIKKAQISFICTTMSILFVVFAVIGFGIYAFLYRSTERYIDLLLNDSVATFRSVGYETVHPDCLIATITYSPITDRYEYRYMFDVNAFSEESAKTIVDTAITRPYYSGNVDNVYYKIVILNQTSQSYLLVGTDSTPLFKLLSNNLQNCFLIMLGIYAGLFYIVFRVSFSIFSPIREMFNKQKQFISDASHELKTPLTIISANTEVISNDENSKWVNNIRTQTDRMNLLISDMLTLTKIEEGKKKNSAIEFDASNEVINSTLQFDAVAFEKGKIISTDIVEDIKISADIHAFKQLMSILLDNAVKYATENSEILVSLKKENGKAVLTVKNSGSDVPTEDSNKVFERFYRGDSSRSRESGGSGLGLSIAKGIVDANKWKISAQSILNESMTITVIF